MIIDTSRFFWSAFTQRMDSFWDMYTQFKPLVMLPFNIWFFFASLPFRFFFYASSFFYSSKKPITQVKQKISLIKEEVNNTLPESLKSRAPIELRSRKPRGAFDEERPFHGFYAVEKQEQPQEKESTVQSRRNSFSKKESTVQSAPAESAPKTNEVDTLRSRIADLEKEALKSSKEKSSLEQQLEGLEKKFKSGDAALAQAEAERKRFNNLISVEQRKCFDLQQQVVELNAQLKMEREAKQALQSKQSQQAQPEMKKAEGKKKQKKSSPAPAQSARTEQPSAWHGASHTQDYTDLVAKAQREELESGKTFVEVLKESSKPAETSSMSKKDEFTIVGGSDSNHHVFAPVSAV